MTIFKFGKRRLGSPDLNSIVLFNKELYFTFIIAWKWLITFQYFYRDKWVTSWPTGQWFAIPVISNAFDWYQLSNMTTHNQNLIDLIVLSLPYFRLTGVLFRCSSYLRYVATFFFCLYNILKRSSVYIVTRFYLSLTYRTDDGKRNCRNVCK